jgi:hypothetical protein
MTQGVYVYVVWLVLGAFSTLAIKADPGRMESWKLMIGLRLYMSNNGFVSKFCQEGEYCLSKCQAKQAHDSGFIMAPLISQRLSSTLLQTGAIPLAWNDPTGALWPSHIILQEADLLLVYLLLVGWNWKYCQCLRTFMWEITVMRMNPSLYHPWIRKEMAQYNASESCQTQGWVLSIVTSSLSGCLFLLGTIYLSYMNLWPNDKPPGY